MSGIRTVVCKNAIVFLWVALSCPCCAIPLTSQEVTFQTVSSSEVDRLIANLADDDFETREEAEMRLLEIGAGALPALELQRHAGDNELRLRVIRITGLIRRHQLDKLVRGFIAGENLLPGWNTFSESMGSDESVRELYIEVYKRRQSTLDQFEHPENQIELLQELLREFSESGLRQSSFNVDLMACLSMQVIRVLPDVSIEKDLPLFRVPLSRYFNQAVFVELASESNRYSKLHRKAAVNWVNLNDPDLLQLTRRISVATSLDLPEGLKPAIRCLEMTDAVPSGTLRFAIQLMAEHGDKSHVGLLSRHIGNELVLHTARFINKDQQQSIYNVQVGDLALSAMIYLTSQDYKEYGLNLIESSYEGRPLPVRYSGFLNNKDRQSAKTKWTQTRRDLEKKNNSS